MLNSLVAQLAPTPTDIDNWRFAISLIAFTVLALIGAVTVLHHGETAIRRWRRRHRIDLFQRAWDQRIEEVRRRQLDGATRLVSIARRTH